jgi:predicted RNase H-like HicB family nuclease
MKHSSSAIQDSTEVKYSIYRSSLIIPASFISGRDIHRDGCHKQNTLTSTSQGIQDKCFICDIPGLELTQPIEFYVRRDEDNTIIAICDALNTHSTGKTLLEAKENLEYNIADLYNELMEDDEFSEDLLKIKKYLKRIIINQVG